MSDIPNALASYLMPEDLARGAFIGAVLLVVVVAAVRWLT